METKYLYFFKASLWTHKVLYWKLKQEPQEDLLLVSGCPGQLHLYDAQRAKRALKLRQVIEEKERNITSYDVVFCFFSWNDNIIMQIIILLCIFSWNDIIYMT